MPNIPGPIKKLAEKSFSKVANKFVDFVITKYTGKSIKVFEAEGEIEADKVKTKWELLEKPFWLQAEAMKMGRQYSNLGNTLLKTAPLIESSENKILGDNDVFWGLLEHSKEISNDEMQELISKIIAGEYNTPGTYSMGTLQTIKMLGKKELKLLEQIGTLVINGDQIPQDLFALPESVKEIMKEIGVDFASLQTLQNLGLFLPNDMTRTMLNPERKKFKVEYFDEHILFTPVNETIQKIEFPGFYSLSDIGKQIFPHLKPKKNPLYFQWLKDHYRIPGYDIVK
jgi:hypothetical protein